jgi:plasmid stabilization system protein ParE
MLDDAATYIARDSRPAAERLVVQALETAASLDASSQRGRVVRELAIPTVREIFVQRYRLLYEVTSGEVQVLAFLHGARGVSRWRPNA